MAGVEQSAAASSGVQANAITPADAGLGVCEVDAAFVHVGERQASRFYLFTQVVGNPPRSGRKTPQEIGREGLYKAIQTTYAAVFKSDHPCHSGPSYGRVGQEGHPSSSLVCMRNLHNHAALAFPADHKWKAVEKHLRAKQGIKV